MIVAGWTDQDRQEGQHRRLTVAALPAIRRLHAICHSDRSAPSRLCHSDWSAPSRLCHSDWSAPSRLCHSDWRAPSHLSHSDWSAPSHLCHSDWSAPSHLCHSDWRAPSRLCHSDWSAPSHLCHSDWSAPSHLCHSDWSTPSHLCHSDWSAPSHLCHSDWSEAEWRNLAPSGLYAMWNGVVRGWVDGPCFEEARTRTWQPASSRPDPSTPLRSAQGDKPKRAARRMGFRPCCIEPWHVLLTEGVP